eukprot:51323-Eustigmatos_ZCMA.PRE.1
MPDPADYLGRYIYTCRVPFSTALHAALHVTSGHKRTWLQVCGYSPGRAEVGSYEVRGRGCTSYSYDRWKVV